MTPRTSPLDGLAPCPVCQRACIDGVCPDCGVPVVQRPDRVRVGADFNGKRLKSEVTRIDFDTVDGVVCICVEYLATSGITVVDMYREDEPADRERIRNFDTNSREVKDALARSFGR